MASDMRVTLAHELLLHSTCRRRKTSQGVICDRVEAWKNNPRSQRHMAAIEETCCEIAKLRDPIVPDSYWLPDLQQTLEEQFYAICSAIDMLKARSLEDVKLFGWALGKARNVYTEPGSWPCDIEDEHMQMMLAVLEHAITKCKTTCLWFPPDQPKTCFGRVAEALEQAFLYRTRGLEDISLLMSELFTTFDMIYEDATVALSVRMRTRRDPTEELESCGSTLGELSQESPRSPIEHDEGEDTADIKGPDGEVAVTPQICGCRNVLWKSREAKERRWEREEISREHMFGRINEGYSPYRQSTAPFNPSPLGQSVETPPDETAFDSQPTTAEQDWVDYSEEEEEDYCTA